MPRNRFNKLGTLFHINDNNYVTAPTHPEHDRFFKDRRLPKRVSQNIAEVEPEEFNAVVEMIILFKGRCALKQYIKNKPHKLGIKVLARAGASGIIYAYDIYVGKGTVTESSELGISGDIVLKFTGTLSSNKGFKVACDSWFASCGLVCALKLWRIHCVGTVRPNHLPGCTFKGVVSLKKERRCSFDVESEPTNKIATIKWYDNEAVHLVSFYIGVEPTGQVQRWSSTSRTHGTVEQPTIIREYNRCMEGVDLCIMLVKLCCCDIRGKRYYLRIVFHIVVVYIVNAWLLYKRHWANPACDISLLLTSECKSPRLS
ncbi:hypothetical protein HPB49_002086 [Dermacentor silvarum]|uniref:Uncharacterized protein n=1 Tax=Dermacentor silvarum TaxID=543639 RepID=A0ACB8C143_DERSI|nr:hypothetical protein HPB49_002086 [Dermacentor silvarum]